MASSRNIIEHEIISSIYPTHCNGLGVNTRVDKKSFTKEKEKKKKERTRITKDHTQEKNPTPPHK